MSYVQKILQPGERVLNAGQLHWIIYANAFWLLLLAVASFTYYATSQAIAFSGLGVLLVILAAAVAFADWFNQWTTEIAVTNRRIIYKRGFIRRHTAEMNMDKVESVVVDQSVLGRLLDYGTIHVRGTGEGIEHLHKIRAPLELRSSITTHQ